MLNLRFTSEDGALVELQEGVLKPCRIIARRHGWVVVEVFDTKQKITNCYYFKEGDNGWYQMPTERCQKQPYWFYIASPELFVCLDNPNAVRINGQRINTFATNNRRQRKLLKTRAYLEALLQPYRPYL